MQELPSLQNVLDSKGAEYAPFDKGRMARIYANIDRHFGFKAHFAKHCKVIHILGTNGKGSSGRFITMGLRQYGKNVLHFSSPHILNFNERFFLSFGAYCGDVSSERLESSHRALWSIADIREASYFEYATFLAMHLALECEYFVCEAGVGGEYDSTSSIAAHISLYTLIGLDHVDMLGEHISQIALTKLKAMQGACIIARQNEKIVESMALDMAKQKHLACELWQDIALDSRFSNQISAFQSYVATYQLPNFLADNLHNAMRVLWTLGMKFDFNTLGALKLHGRCEQIAHNIVLDVGHNIDGARAVRAYFDTKGIKDVILVYNSYANKEVCHILRELLPIIKEVLVLSLTHIRIYPKRALLGVLDDLGIRYSEFDISRLKRDETYLVFGSFSVAEAFLRAYRGIDSIEQLET